MNTAKLLIAGLAAPAGVGLTMFSFVPIAVPVALVGWLVLLLTAPLLLRGRHEAPERDSSWRVEIPLSERANAIGRTAAEVGIDFTPDFELLEIRRWGERLDRDRERRRRARPAVAHARRERGCEIENPHTLVAGGGQAEAEGETHDQASLMANFSEGPLTAKLRVWPSVIE